MAKPTDLVQGTLDLLIFKTISLEPKHGWAIAKRIQQVSCEALQIQQGSLYPALHRLEQQDWINSEWRATETGRMAKFYSLTRSGRRHRDRAGQDLGRVPGGTVQGHPNSRQFLRRHNHRAGCSPDRADSRRQPGQPQTRRPYREPGGHGNGRYQRGDAELPDHQHGIGRGTEAGGGE